MIEQKLNRTFATKLPDRPGAFMLASKIIMKHNGNIVRVSYNKADNLNTLFVEVKASSEDLDIIEKEFNSIKYLKDETPEEQIVVVNIKMKDEPGILYPVLEIFDRYDINLSYLNSNTENGEFQNFKIGLIIEKPEIVKHVLDDICDLYQVDVVSYTGKDATLDNTISYIHLSNEMQRMFSLSMKTTMKFVQESKRISKSFLNEGEDPQTLFNNIRSLSYFIADNRNENFKPIITKHKIADNFTLHVIEPPCGSNTYIIETKNELLFIDTGFSIYADEMMDIFKEIFPSFYNMKKKILVTHADIYHCGLLSVIDDADIYLSQKSSDYLNDLLNDVVNYKGENIFYLGFSRLSRIFSEYIPPQNDHIKILGKTVSDVDGLFLIDKFNFSDMIFEIYEGNGEHMLGETVFLCKDLKIMFTGDAYVNTERSSPQGTEFNKLSAQLMINNNKNSVKVKKTLEAVKKLMNDIGKDGLLVCSGHGPVEKF